jgi:protoheme IX farnesyltransferase
MVLSTAILIPVSLVPTALGFTGGVYAVAATVFGLVFLSSAVRALRDMSESSARRVFLTSLVYHPLLVVFMLFDTVRL